MSEFEGNIDDQFSDNPFLLMLDAELNMAHTTMSKGEILQERLEGAPTLVDLNEARPDSMYAVDLELTPDSGRVERVYFHKGYSAQPGETAWWWMPPTPDDRNLPWRPITLVGAHVPNTPFGHRGVIKLGLGLSFYESKTFRSSEDVPGLFKQPLPPPESLDQHLWAECVSQGLVVTGADNRYYWRIPTNVYDTGRVLGASELLRGVDWESNR